MSKKADYIDFLLDELASRIKVNPYYSQRAFAKFLGISPGPLNEILKGKRKLSLKGAMKMAKKLQLSKVETRDFLALVDNQEEGETVFESSLVGKQLSNDTFDVVSDWYCFAILSLADCEDFKWTELHISKRLGISLWQAKDAVNKLVRVGLVEKTKKGHRACPDFVLSPDGVASKAVRKFHHSILQKAQDALETQSVEEREISGVFLALDPKKLNKIKSEIDQFQNDLVEKYSKGKQIEVYQFETALFRLSVPGKERKK